MKHVKLFEQFLNEGYYDKPFYVISIDSEMSDRATDQYTGEGKPARVIATFDNQAEAKKFASEKRRGLKTLTKTKRKMHDRDYKVVPGDRSKLTNIKESSINEAKGDKITIHWSGLPVGPKGTIGTFIVSPKVHDQIEDEMGRSISIDFEDENVTGKLASFNDVMNSIKKSDYGKLAFSESADSSINEAYNRWYIETWYDQDGRKVQLLGSDGTTVTKRQPFDKDVENHHDRITKLRKIKPFLVGDVEYRVVDGQGRTLKTYDRAIEESAVNENRITIDGTDVFSMAKTDRYGSTHLQFNPSTALDAGQKGQLAKAITDKLKGKKIDLASLLKDANVSENGILFEVNLYQLMNAVEKALK